MIEMSPRVDLTSGHHLEPPVVGQLVLEKELYVLAIIPYHRPKFYTNLQLIIQNKVKQTTYLEYSRKKCCDFWQKFLN